ncbi:MAG: ribose-phosphate pyrophosphokinase-like domain-containing protein, partial [Papillibacter sp.]|nr:ribose-phosphate pyrophosphokinase-like domain-containing protein [Papillibacter sp.]
MYMDAEQIFHTGNSYTKLGIIALKGAENLAYKIDKFLVNWAAMGPEARDTFIIEAECPRFSSGDGKGLIKESVRGMDIYIIADVGNYNCTYKMFGYVNHMSPDDHFADLKRIIQAASGKAKSISVIMPQLYGMRQHRRNSRESLDCAVALQELQNMGVKNIVTFDTHDARVQNAVPLMGFDNLMPHYQVLKALFNRYPDISTNKNKFMVVSPDEGAMSRNMYYSSVLGVDLGMFYKRRDYSQVVNGRNPIIAHEYLGS